MATEKRYQVFVSSTYLDLVDERKEVMQALLELDCIPSGMELFQAADEDQWTLIKRVIDDCDYYMVIIGGRYGSVGPAGISFTEMEYRYALEQEKPTVAFLHDKPEEIANNRTESTDEGRQRLENFRNICQQKVVKYWNSPEGLGSVVSRSIIRLIKDRPAVGWVRGDAVSSEEASQEILSLRKKIDDLQRDAGNDPSAAPEGTAHLIQIHEDFPVTSIVSFRQPGNRYATDRFRYNGTLQLNDLLKSVGPHMIDEITETKMDSLVDQLFANKFYKEISDHDDSKDKDLTSIEASSGSFQEIKIQLLALGIIVKGDRRRPPSDSNVYWRLTKYGERLVMSSMAKRRFSEDFDGSGNPSEDVDSIAA